MSKECMKNFISFEKAEKQKELFFQINDYFGEKISGLYVIFKDDICLYVGQSTNLSSRIATHLKGKYESCDIIEVYEDSEEMGNLLDYEKLMIQKLKPIENVLVDFSEKIDVIENPCYDRPSSTIINNQCELFIDTDMTLSLYADDNITKYIKDIFNHHSKFKGDNNEL